MPAYASSASVKIDTNTSVARPFIKWAGGKGQLLSQLSHYYPHGLSDGSITRYVEPFLGGGAVFFNVAQIAQVREFHLFDINPDLSLVYKVVQREPEALIERLIHYRDQYADSTVKERERLFYQVRSAYNAQRPHIDFQRFSDAWIDRAAHMIFLNKTCYNGLFRVNSRGLYNVPFGRYVRPSIVDADNIQRVSELLQRAHLDVGSFDTCRPHIHDRSFVYFDPPYRPLNTTSCFTSYAVGKFGDADQADLATFFTNIDGSSDASLMLSNSNPRNSDPGDDFFDRLYAPFQIRTVYANRMINRKANGRGKISELLITNY